MKAMSSNPNTKDRNRLIWRPCARSLREGGGKRFWQSLDELSETPEYREFLENEFPRQCEEAKPGESTAAKC